MSEPEDARSLDLTLHGGGVYWSLADAAGPTSAQAHSRDATGCEQLPGDEPGAKPFPERTVARFSTFHLGVLRSNSHAAKHRM
jgi:hypothetical protein